MAIAEKDAIQRRDEAIELARKHGNVVDTRHKSWVIDQMCRTLLGDEYDDFVASVKAGVDGPHTYNWSVGTAP